MDPIAEMNSLPEKLLQNGHKKKSKKKNKILTKTLELTNQIVNNCSDNNNDSSVTELDEISLQIDNCHIKENGLLHENGVGSSVDKVKKKKNKNKKPHNSNSSTSLVEDDQDMSTADGELTTFDKVDNHDSCCTSSIETPVKNILPESSLAKNNELLTPKEPTQDQVSEATEPLQSTSSMDRSENSQHQTNTQSSSSSAENEASTSSTDVSLGPSEAKEKVEIKYIQYESEQHMPDIMRVIQKDLSEPYSIYTYRYFIHNWPNLCFLALHDDKCVGAIVCKFDLHRDIRRGYIAMLAVDKDYRKLKIGTTLVQKAIKVMVDLNADEVVLETEITNKPALKLYENLGFVRDKRLFYYYLNGVDALRLKLWFR